jgi:hypothetical protein
MITITNAAYGATQCLLLEKVGRDEMFQVPWMDLAYAACRVSRFRIVRSSVQIEHVFIHQRMWGQQMLMIAIARNQLEQCKVLELKEMLSGGARSPPRQCYLLLLGESDVLFLCVRPARLLCAQLTGQQTSPSTAYIDRR